MWRGALIIVLLIAVGLAIGGGTALIANHLASAPRSTPEVVVAMTPPPAGSYQTAAPATPIPANRRFSTAKPAQMTPAPTLPPTPQPPAPAAPTASPAPSPAEQTLPPRTPPGEASGAATTRPVGARVTRSTVPIAPTVRPTPEPTPSIVVTAEQFVREYLRALDRGDATTAYAYLGGRPGEPGIEAQEEPLARGGGLHVLSLEATPDGTASAIVHARLESRGLRYRATYYVEPFMNGPHELVIEHVDLQQE